MDNSRGGESRSRAGLVRTDAVVLAIDTHWSSVKGGISTFNRHLCAALARSGATVYCLVLQADEAEIEDAEANRVRLLLPDSNIRSERALSVRPLALGDTAPSIIIGHGRITGLAAEEQRNNFPGAQFLYFVHTDPESIDQFLPPDRNPIGDSGEQKLELERRLARSADRVFAVGPRLQDAALDLVSRSVRSVRIDPGFDLPDDQLINEPRRAARLNVLVIGRLEEEPLKGVEIAARAVGRAREKYPLTTRDVRLILRGVKKGAVSDVRRRAAEWAGTSMPNVFPRTYSADAHTLRSDLEQAAVVLMPSLSEGFGLAAQEAIAAGVPVLISDCSGLADLLKEIIGSASDEVIVPIDRSPADIDRWTDAVHGVLRSPGSAFARAVDLRTTMRARRTWDGAASEVIRAWSVTPAAAGLGRPTGHPVKIRIYWTDGKSRKLAERLLAVIGHMMDGTFPELSEEGGAMDSEAGLASVNLVVLGRSDVSGHGMERLIQVCADARSRGRRVVVVQEKPGTAIPDWLEGAAVVEMNVEVDRAWTNLAQHLYSASGKPSVAVDAVTRGGEQTSAKHGDDEKFRMRLINEMPELPSAVFRERSGVLPLLERALADRETGLIVLHGAAGIGKTTLLKELCDRLANDTAKARADAFIYLTPRSSRWLTVPAVMTALCEAVADPKSRAKLRTQVENPVAPWRVLLKRVFEQLLDQRVVVVLDDADQLFDEDGAWRNRELFDLVHAMWGHPRRGTTVVIAAQSPLPRWLDDMIQRGNAKGVLLDGGLPSEGVDEFLRALAAGGTADELSDETLIRLHDVTHGLPRALELVMGQVNASRGESTIDEVLDAVADTEDVVRALVALMIGEMKARKKQVIRALAIFGRPVPLDAIEYLAGEQEKGATFHRVLDDLVDSFLVHRYGDRYYLPPTPDGELVLESLDDDSTAGPRGARRAGDLWRRAVEYFEAQQESTQVVAVKDLDPYFGAIELCIRAGDAKSAVARMNSLDKQHLVGLRQSHVLIPWRQQLRSRVDEPDLAGENLSYLVAARRDHGRYDNGADDVRDLSAALTYADETGDSAKIRAVRLQLAYALLDSGSAARARSQFERIADEAAGVTNIRDETSARVGHAICLVKRGEWNRAEDELRRAFSTVSRRRPTSRTEIRASLLLTEGWLYGQSGQYDQGLAALGEALNLVSGRADEVLYGRLLAEQASLHLALGNPDLALSLSGAASSIGSRLDNYRLERDAACVQVLALLCGDQPKQAVEVAKGVVTQRAVLTDVAAVGLLGLALYRVGKDEQAMSAFERADGLAARLVAPHADIAIDHQLLEIDFQLLDSWGVALSGVTLNDPRRADDARRVFGAARAIMSMRGATDRVQLLLGQFFYGRVPAALEDIRAIAVTPTQ